ncbi:hypothetical protein Tco_0451567 [Tanacetum coccineum]
MVGFKNVCGLLGESVLVNGSLGGISSFLRALKQDAGMFNGIVLIRFMHLSHYVLCGRCSVYGAMVLVLILGKEYDIGVLLWCLGVSSLYALIELLCVNGFGGLQLKRTCYGLGLLKLFMAKMGKMVADSRLVTSHWRSILQKWKPLKIKGYLHLNNFSRRKDLQWCEILIFGEDLWQEDMVNWTLVPFRRAPRCGVERDQLTDLTNLRGRFPEVSNQTRWIKGVPIKVNIHAWKVRMDCLPTRFNISGEILPVGGTVAFHGSAYVRLNGFLDRNLQIPIQA